jgi:hypothetical protein
MERLVFAAASVILILWTASVLISMFVPSRTIQPSLQIAMVATTTFLYGSVWMNRRKGS